MKYLLLIAAMLTSLSISAEMLPAVELKGDEGGRLDGKAWSSAEIKDKVYVLFYVDPDEKDLNNHVSDALKAENFPLAQYGSIAIINMAATWKPNFAIESALKSKQEQFPNTLYLKDFDKVLVKKWKMKDDSSNVLLFSKAGKLVYRISGKATADQLKELIKLTKENLKM
jgi:predicted transcriptional regulator